MNKEDTNLSTTIRNSFTEKRYNNAEIIVDGMLLTLLGAFFSTSTLSFGICLIIFVVLCVLGDMVEALYHKTFKKPKNDVPD